MRGALVAVLIALGLPAGAYGAEPCAPPPALAPAPAVPDDDRPTWAARAAALKAEKAWSAPRTAYGACRRAELQTLAGQVNDLGRQANAIIEEWNALDAKVRAARAGRIAIMRAFAERRGRPFEEWPYPNAAASPGPPCSSPPGAAPPPAPPNPAKASVREMNRSQEAFELWLAPRADYLACRKAEGRALAAAYAAGKVKYEAARDEYDAYRKDYNAIIAAFERGLEAYTRRLREQAP